MRPLKKLLEILKKDIKDRHNVGVYLFMCNSIKHLYKEGKISEEELDLVLKYMNENRPYGFTINKSWFEPNDYKSRINWLNEQINKL
mgnify:CR=1 FL=1